MTSNPLTILFGGAEKTATLLNGATEQVFVRALPEVYLGQVLAVAENEQALIELVCYIRPADAAAAEPGADPIIPPTGFVRVSPNWALNLSSASHIELLEEAKQQNFTRTEAWARRQISAKKWLAPIHGEALAQISPVIEKMAAVLVERFAQLSGSTPKSPLPADIPASSS
jgi:hypothetical protein